MLSKEELQSLLKQAQEANEAKDFSKAETLTKQVLDDPVSDAFEEIKIPALLQLCFVNLEQRKITELLTNAQLALKLTDEAKHEELINWQAKANSFLGDAYKTRGEHPKALEFYTKALKLHEKLGDQLGIAKAIGSIGIIHFMLSDYPKALDYYTKTLELNEEIGDPLGIAKCNTNIGLVYHNLSDYPKALDFFAKALELHEKAQNQLGVSKTNMNIGRVYSALSDHSKALDFYNRALKLLEDPRDQLSIAKTTTNIGLEYFYLSDYPKALEFYFKAVKLHEKARNQLGVAITTSNIGSVYLKLSDYSKAQELFARALEIYKKVGEERGMAVTLASIGTVYSKKKYSGYDAQKSEEYLLSSLKLNDELGAKEGIMNAHKELSDLYKQNNRLEEALEQKELYYQTKERVHSVEVKKQAGNFAIERQLQEREKEIAVERAASVAKQEATTGLLHRVLPDTIANRMLEGETEIADYFPATSILFADVVGFTPLTSGLPAYMLVRLLNNMFNRFDAIMREHGCTKIKTIGDGYMAVAGAPEACEDHAERLVKAAIEMLKPFEIPRDIEVLLPDEAELKVRIGIHTGAVVAGVVGDERFMYDIYSEAVNTAARMESHGEAGRIHVSVQFMRHLLDRFAMTKTTDHGINFEKRGEIEVKGKGKMKTFFINLET